LSKGTGNKEQRAESEKQRAEVFLAAIADCEEAAASNFAHGLPSAAQRSFYSAALRMDLQWFASPEEEGRTHDPTEATYRRAREEGRVSKSQELIAALGLLLPGIVIIFLAPWILRNFVEMLQFFFTRINELDPLTDRLTAVVFANYFLRLMLPIFAIAIVAALFSNIIQVGFLFATKPLEPDFSKVLPKFGRYFGKIFSMEGVFNFLKSILKMGVIGAVAFINISADFNRLINLQTSGLWEGISLISSLAARLLIITALLLIVLSVPDIFFQRWQFKQSLKMTREKAKEEIKQDEGNMEMRQKLRHRYRDMLSQNVTSAVPNADVVITNPTHYSVALEFDADRMEAPTVVAKGEDDLAFRIREIAKENGVPVVSHPPLTRTLYSETEIGDQIPLRYWNVVAMVVGKFFSYEQKQAKAMRNEKKVGA